MKKLLIASAVSAALAAPTVALAQAARAPTLAQVLDSSGISVNGYIDAGYTHADKNVEAGIGTLPAIPGTPATVPPRVFDNKNNSFDVNQFGLSVSKLPKQGFGGLVNLTIGSDAQVIHSFPETAGTGSSMFDVTQAYAQYAGGPLTVIAGKFATLHGTEVIWSPSNNNISRSILFGAVPFTHTGVRATWAVSDTVSLIGGVNNGWDELQDPNRGKTVELGATLNPIRPLNISISGYSGKEPVGTTGDGTRTSINAVGSYNISDAISVGAELLNVSQDIPGAGGSTTSAKYTGVAGYGSYMFTRRIRGALRVENFDDKDGLHFRTANTKYREVTATGAYLYADNFEARAEVRRDQATNAVFRDFNGTTSKTLTTIALQGLYKF
jgi:opacity protein-like surface antigen